MKKTQENNQENESFLKRNYSLCKKFLEESRTQIKIALGIFLITFLIGFIFPIFFNEEIKLFVEEMLESFKSMGTTELILFIFLNNLKASFFAMVLGIGLAIFPVITAIINGYLLGFISRVAVKSEGISVLWRIIPHGIFELPAILFSIGIGIKIGTDILKKTNKKNIKENFKEALRFFIFVIIPLLLIAGIIEGILIKLFG